MIVQLRERALLASLPITSLRSYLASRAWNNIGPWGERPAAVYSKLQEDDSWEVIVPSSDTLADYPEAVSEAIWTLAKVEQRSPIDVFYDVLGAGSDVIQLKSPRGKASEYEGLSLQQSAGLFDAAYDMLASAARAAEKTQVNYRGRLSAEVAGYLDTVRPVPTTYEGYSLTLHSPVPARFGVQEDLGEDFQSPFSRRVTHRLAEALDRTSESVVAAVNTDSIEQFSRAVEYGVSSNFCESLASIAEEGRGVAISLFWAQVRPSPYSERTFEFSENSARILGEVARELRRQEPFLDEEVLAQVVKLEREPEEFDGRALLLYIRDGRPMRLKVEFESTSYKTVIEAFGGHQPIRVEGDIYRVGNTYELRRPRNLAPVRVS